MNVLRQTGRRRAALALLVAAPFLAGVAAAQEQPASSKVSAPAAEDGATDGGTVVLGTGLAFSLVGFIFAGNTIRTRRRADAAAKWPTTTGEVLSSNVVEETGRDSDGHLETTYTPVVRYAYEVGGQSHVGIRIRVSDVAFGRRKKAEEIVARYPEGARVQVRYDPADPASTVLETVKPGVGTAIFGGVLLTLGVLLSLAGFAAV